MTTSPVWNDPLQELQARSDWLRGQAALAAPPSPLRVRAAGDALTLSLDAHDLLVGLEVNDPVPSPAALTSEFRQLLERARHGLLTTSQDEAPGVERFFDEHNPHPGLSDRLQAFTPGEDADELPPGQLQERVRRVLASVEGFGASGPVSATVQPGGGIIGLVFGEVAQDTGAEVSHHALTALERAAADAAKQAADAARAERLPLGAPLTQLLLSNPYTTEATR